MSLFNEDSPTEFSGQFALVTGGATGIGLHCVKELLKYGIEKVAVVDKFVAQDACRRLVTEYGKDRLMFVRCDVSIPNELENAFKAVTQEFQSLNILINNAGILNDSEWEKEILVNLNGTVRGTILGMKYMSKFEGGAGGTILNVSATSGLTPSAGSPIYTATSHAIIGLTRSYSMPYHNLKSGVRMMTLCPGITYTKIMSGATKKMLDEDMGKEWLKEISMTSTQKPENVGQGARHMLINGKNGSVWVSDGGKTVFEVFVPTLIDMQRVQSSK